MQPRRQRLTAGIFTLSCFFPLSSVAGETPLRSELVASGLFKPLFVTAPPGDSQRLFVVEKEGAIRIVKDGVLLPDPFIEIEVARSTDHRGLLGMAFDPEFALNGYFYVSYVLELTSHIVRYEVSAGDPDRADPESALSILTQTQPGVSHNGGMIAFSPRDEMLYIGFGDGGAGPADPDNSGQSGSTWLGKMLRIDVRNTSRQTPYVVPPDNPFVGDPAHLDEIWAKGLRSPWRWSFDRANGDLYLGDVGLHDREEIDYQPGSSVGGENYGWRCMEGTRCTGFGGCACDGPELTPPIYEYNRGTGIAVIGGYVYRGRNIPDLRGTYFFADHSRNRPIWSFRVVDGKPTDLRERGDELRPDGKGEDLRVASFGEDAGGELYMVSYRYGQIFKIVPDGFVVGDVNCDGSLDEFDVEPFLVALFDPQGYGNRYPECELRLADINCDESIDAFDIEPFLELLFGP